MAVRDFNWILTHFTIAFFWYCPTNLATYGRCTIMVTICWDWYFCSFFCDRQNAKSNMQHERKGLSQWYRTLALTTSFRPFVIVLLYVLVFDDDVLGCPLADDCITTVCLDRWEGGYSASHRSDAFSRKSILQDGGFVDTLNALHVHLLSHVKSETNLYLTRWYSMSTHGT